MKQYLRSGYDASLWIESWLLQEVKTLEEYQLRGSDEPMSNL
jgi:hypothetical protein